MNLNIVSYLIYLPVTAFITIVVGHKLHRDGRYFLLEVFNETHVADAVNNFLLAGYYLLNIGYAVLIVWQWGEVQNVTQLTEKLSFYVGWICVSLAMIHYFNLTVFNIIYRKKKPMLNA